VVIYIYLQSLFKLIMGDAHTAVSIKAREQLDNVDAMLVTVCPDGTHGITNCVIAL
jgi:hypothetical protein